MGVENHFVNPTQTKMTSVRRSKTTLSPDSQTAKFLYTILKQLDLKSIDWNEVAAKLDITNGHAARMRFSRFKQQIEGTASTPRGSRAKKDANKIGKGKGKGLREYEYGRFDFMGGGSVVKLEANHDSKRIKLEHRLDPGYISYGVPQFNPHMEPYSGMSSMGGMMDLKHAEPTTTLQNPTWFHGQTTPMQIMDSVNFAPAHQFPAPLPTVALTDLCVPPRAIRTLPSSQYELPPLSNAYFHPTPTFPTLPDQPVTLPSISTFTLPELGSVVSNNMKQEKLSEEVGDITKLHGVEVEQHQQQGQNEIIVKNEVEDNQHQEIPIKCEMTDSILIE